MFFIYRVDTRTFYEDKFNNYEEAVQMIKWFIQDDMEYNEPVFTYAVLDYNRKPVTFLHGKDKFQIINP